MVLMSWDAPQLGDSLHSSTVTAHAKILSFQTCSSAVQTPLSAHQLKAGAMECPIVQMDQMRQVVALAHQFFLLKQHLDTH